MKIIEGKMAEDDRGSAVFVNDFDFKDVKRFFMIQNRSTDFVRAWHGHKQEARYVLVVKGSILLGAVEISDWDNPSAAVPQKLVLTALKPQVVYIPPNSASGFKTLTDDAQVMFFSTTTFEESKNDDFRFPPDTWDIWT